ncbi:MAG: glycosyltransferase family 4 protein [Thermaerobacter sp.]|nr:glycosyltransferase family 4 protein [Thermaerobacter sp.]
MRILELITGGEPGGAQRHLVALTQYLAAAGEEMTVVHGGGSWVASRLAGCARIVRLPDLVRAVRPGKDWRAARQLRRMLLGDPPDLIHCHSSKAGVVGRWVAGRLGIPAVYTAHGYVFQDPTRAGWERRLYRRLEAWGARHAAAVIALTEADAAFAAGAGAKPRTYYIPNGVPIPPAPRRRRPGPPTVGFLGRFSREKGLDTLLPLARRETQWRWLLAGSGPQEEMVRAAAAAAHITWLGWIEERDPDFWEAIDLLVQPSWKEGAPYTVLDAMAAGVPVVATRVGALSSMLGAVDPALLVEPGDGAGLKRAINFAWTHRERLGRACHQEARARFDIQDQHRTTHAVLLEAARR